MNTTSVYWKAARGWRWCVFVSNGNGFRSHLTVL